MSFLDGLSRTVDTAVVSMKGNIEAVGKPLSDALAPVEAGGQPKPVSQPLRTATAVAGTVMAAINAPTELMNTGFAVATNAIAAIFPTLPACTMGSMYIAPPHAHAHPPSLIPPAPPVPLPSLGPIMLGTCVKVLIGGMPAARAGDIGFAPTCGGLAPAFEIFLGSSKVFVGGTRAARMTDICKSCFPSGAGAARGAAAAMAIAGQAIAVAGIVADSVDALNGGAKPDADVMAASGVSAAMSAAQLVADAAATAIMATMGADPGIPPTPGVMIDGNPIVQIGGFPMINFPNPAMLLFGKIKAMRAKKKAAKGADAGCPTCPG